MNDHDLLVRIDEKLTSLHSIFESHQTDDLSIHEDVESRLRTLESTKQSQKGALTVVVAVVSAIWAVILVALETLLGKHHG